jgi:NADH-quinone oxidoreductase subunit C
MQATAWEGEFSSRLVAAFPDLRSLSYVGQNFLEVPLTQIFEVIAYLNREEEFDTLTDLTAVDHPSDAERFELIYILYSFPRNERIRVKTRVAVDVPVPSIVEVFVGANWLEREVFDMFGIPFAGHPDLKRILMPDEWQGYPLRKDSSIVGMDNEWVQTNLGIESGQ